MPEVKLSAATLQGSRHRREGTPCQDCAATLSLGGTHAAALCDGAGSLPHSHLGAGAAAGAAVRLLCGSFEELWTLPPRALGRRVLEELLRAMAETGRPLPELGCTLLFCACREGRFLAGHLGDGLMALVRRGEALPLSLPENGSEPGETWFLTSPDAPERLRLYRGELGPGPGTVLLTSDGVSGQLLDRRTRRLSPACLRLARWAEEYSPAEMEEILRGNLREVLSQGTPDDLGIALLHWGEEEAAPGPRPEDETK